MFVVETALAAAVIRLVESSDLATSLATAARRRVEASFSLDAMVAGYTDLYGRLLRRGAA